MKKLSSILLLVIGVVLVGCKGNKEPVEEPNTIYFPDTLNYDSCKIKKNYNGYSYKSEIYYDSDTIYFYENNDGNEIHSYIQVYDNESYIVFKGDSSFYGYEAKDIVYDDDTWYSCKIDKTGTSYGFKDEGTWNIPTKANFASYIDYFLFQYTYLNPLLTISEIRDYYLNGEDAWNSYDKTDTLLNNIYEDNKDYLSLPEGAGFYQIKNVVTQQYYNKHLDYYQNAEVGKIYIVQADSNGLIKNLSTTIRHQPTEIAKVKDTNVYYYFNKLTEEVLLPLDLDATIKLNY